MAAAPWSAASSTRCSRSEACGLPSLASSRGARSRTALDLTEVEGLADLIAAETEAQARQALAQAEGGARALYEVWREDLRQGAGAGRGRARLRRRGRCRRRRSGEGRRRDRQAARRDRAASADRRGERLRDGFRVVIAGPPNAGKSSLLNALARRDVAIVSEEAGTTRDVIEVHLDFGGLPVILTDTAGMREAGGAVEAEGISRTLGAGRGRRSRAVAGRCHRAGVRRSAPIAGTFRAIARPEQD